MGAKYNEWFVEGLIDKGYARVTEELYWTPSMALAPVTAPVADPAKTN